MKKNREVKDPSEVIKIVVEVRVVKKVETISMANGRKLFKFNVTDKHGDKIECISYHETHDQFYPLVKEQEVVWVVNPSIQTASRSNTSIENDFRLIMKEDS
mmetsp:Transcript_783/g.1398  ORF Transcript_783/g.1398 Transcript_783/m.1398 type:complete len:102 (+) Transcript_783:451-756(+)